jgi:hypothetical protein
MSFMNEFMSVFMHEFYVVVYVIYSERRVSHDVEYMYQDGLNIRLV